MGVEFEGLVTYIRTGIAGPCCGFSITRHIHHTYKLLSHRINIHTPCHTHSPIIPNNNFTFIQYIFYYIHVFIRDLSRLNISF